MKRVTLTHMVIFSVFCVGVSSLLFLDTNDTDKTQAPSQLGIQVDASSAKDFFEYSLSTLGENNIKQITDNVNSNDALQVSLNIDDELFERYLAYKRSLSELDLPMGNVLTLDKIKELDTALARLQREFFTEEQINELFTEENQLRQLAIQKLTIQNSHVDALTQQQLMEDLLANQAEYIQQSEKNSTLITQLNKASELNEQDKYFTHVDLVGEDGAERLKALDEQRSDFNSSLDSYMKERSKILNNTALGEPEKQLEVVALREQSFQQIQWRRVEALERIYDAK